MRSGFGSVQCGARVRGQLPRTPHGLATATAAGSVANGARTGAVPRPAGADTAAETAPNQSRGVIVVRTQQLYADVDLVHLCRTAPGDHFWSAVTGRTAYGRAQPPAALHPSSMAAHRPPHRAAVRVAPLVGGVSTPVGWPACRSGQGSPGQATIGASPDAVACGVPRRRSHELCRTAGGCVCPGP